MWLKKINLKIIKILYNTGVTYPSPTNLTYFWNFGIYAIICLVIQFITGIFLSMYYTANVDFAFISIEHIMRDVNYGWLLRYTHANGASLFFSVVYIHMFRGLYYDSFMYPRHLLWVSGVIIFILMITTAFSGYVLPWGQMSYWAATVITNLFSAIPSIGNDIVIWLWGDYGVNNPTLMRFYSLHYSLPFVILMVVGLHLIILHENGSNNSLGITFKNIDKVSFAPSYIVKDTFGIIFFIFSFIIFIFYKPNILGHTDNYIYANSLVTPTHIVPEWYFLPFYAMLRSVPDKLMGVVTLFAASVLLSILPFIYRYEINIMSNDIKPISNLFFWFFVVAVLLLGWLGGKPIEEPYSILSQCLTLFYFSYFLYLYPLGRQIDYYLFCVSTNNMELFDLLYSDIPNNESQIELLEYKEFFLFSIITKEKMIKLLSRIKNFSISVKERVKKKIIDDLKDKESSLYKLIEGVEPKEFLLLSYKELTTFVYIMIELILKFEKKHYLLKILTRVIGPIVILVSLVKKIIGYIIFMILYYVFLGLRKCYRKYNLKSKK